MSNILIGSGIRLEAPLEASEVMCVWFTFLKHFWQNVYEIKL